MLAVFESRDAVIWHALPAEIRRERGRVSQPSTPGAEPLSMMEINLARAAPFRNPKGATGNFKKDRFRNLLMKGASTRLFAL